MSPPPDSLVLGATGFIGRWLLAELLRRGHSVAAGVRGGPDREPYLRDWLRAHDAPVDRLSVVHVDITRPGLDLDGVAARHLAQVRDVHNCASLFRFGLARQEARAVNVDGARNVLAWAAGLSGLRRVVHITGYRVAAHPGDPAGIARLYRKAGAYEASKVEADATVRALAERDGLPLSIVNPSTVIGHSATGEAGQYLGLAETVRTLWQGRLRLLPGGEATFVPVVAVDHLARFLAEVPGRDTGGVRAHWVLDETTPNLPELVAHLADHLGVPAPRRSVPTALLRRLPRAVTRVEPETLPFLAADRYDTASAHALARTAGLRHPPVRDALSRWADRLVADGFGALPPGRPGGLHPVAGSRTYLVGERAAPDYVLLHGLPLDGESWQDVADRLDGSTLVPDLPGLGRSAPARVPAEVWLAELLAPAATRPVLVGHSAGCAPALRHAHAHPDRVAALVLVAPAFLQPHASPLLRIRPLARRALARMTPGRLAAFTGLGEEAAGHRAVASAALNLRRSGAAARAAAHLAAARRPAERAALRNLLAACPVPVTLVVGEHDPVDASGLDVPVVTVPAAGHYPQLTAAQAVAEQITRAAAEARAAA